MKGKVTLITGASSGIGAGTAVFFASHGCLLSLTGRNETDLQETAQKCIQAGSKSEEILVIPADLEIQENLSMIIDKTLEKFRKLDILINNAGHGVSANFVNTTMEVYDTTMNTNLRAIFFLTQLALPHLIKTKGNVVNVSSVTSVRPGKGCFVYSMGKAALDHFTRILAVELALQHVRVNAVNPAIIKTKLILERSGFSGEFAELERRYHAMERSGTVEEVAKSIAFLADEEQSSFITGVTLLVDGGSFLVGPH